jgi:hypothetical protein
MFTKLCGKDACRNVVLVTTRWPNVDRAAGKLRELELSQKYWNEMIRHGSRTMQYYEDSPESAWDVINSVAEREIKDIQIQRELVDLHLRLQETQAAKALRCELQELLVQHMMRLQELGRQRTPESEESYDETMGRVRLLLLQVQELSVPLSLKIKRLFNII